MIKKLLFILVYGGIGFPAAAVGFLYEVIVIGILSGRRSALNIFPLPEKTKKD